MLQALGVFGLCQIHAFVDYVRSKLSSEQFNLLFRSIVLLVGIVGTVAAAIATATGSILLKLQLIYEALLFRSSITVS